VQKLREKIYKNVLKVYSLVDIHRGQKNTAIWSFHSLLHPGTVEFEVLPQPFSYHANPVRFTFMYVNGCQTKGLIPAKYCHKQQFTNFDSETLLQGDRYLIFVSGQDLWRALQAAENMICRWKPGPPGQLEGG
jgi:hypothetical protein